MTSASCSTHAGDLLHAAEPDAGCTLCPRFAALREPTLDAASGWPHPLNPVGASSARLLIVCLEPVREEVDSGSTPTFCDTEGSALLLDVLHEIGFLPHHPTRHSTALELADCRIVSAMRCVAPNNIPLPSEIATCNQFLRSELQTMSNLQVVLALGVLAHNATVTACGIPMTRAPFRSGQIMVMPDGLRLADSPHLSRANIAKGMVTHEGLQDLLRNIRNHLTG